MSLNFRRKITHLNKNYFINEERTIRGILHF